MFTETASTMSLSLSQTVTTSIITILISIMESIALWLHGVTGRFYISIRDAHQQDIAGESIITIT